MKNMYPMIQLEKLKLSKIVCGTNQFLGITHRSNPFEILAHKFQYREPITVAKYIIHLGHNHGVNCIVSSPRMKIYNAIQIAEKELGSKIHWLCTPSVRNTVKGLEQDLFKQIEWCADHHVSVCMPHRIYTDMAMDMEQLVIGGITYEGKDVKFKGRWIPVKSIRNECKIPYPEVAAFIRDKGMIPGLSTHYIEAIEAVERNKYDASLIIQPLNKIGFESNTDPETLTKKIQSTKLQILNIKPMAAGRIPAREAFEYCLKRIKKNDFMAMGFGKFEYCVEDGEIVADILDSHSRKI